LRETEGGWRSSRKSGVSVHALPVHLIIGADLG
jgi:hypothetical protein